MLYADFRNTLQETLDAKLRLKADGIENSIRTYWQTEKLEMTKEWANSFLFFKRKDDRFEQIAYQLTIEELNRGDDIFTVSFIFDPQGTLIASSHVLEDTKPFKKIVLSTAVNKTNSFDVVRLNILSGQAVPFRVITKPVMANDKVKYVVAVMTSLIPLSKELAELQQAFFLQIPIILLIAIIGALVLVQVTLHPVDEMVRSIKQINADTLRLRLKVPNTDDEIARLAETFNDMLEELEQSFISQRQIVQDVSHELRTPLTILQGQQEVALRRERSVEEYKEVLYSNLEEIEKMKHMVNNLLLLAKIDKDSILKGIGSVDINKLINKMVEDITILAEDKKIQISIFERNKNILVKGDETYLKLLFLNIMDNAIKYTPKGGKIIVELIKLKSWVLVRIEDSGVGIDEKDIPYIFNRFYRVDKTRRGGEGFGLGLSIVKSVLDLHKGNIRVESEINKGTTFYIHLPLST